VRVDAVVIGAGHNGLVASAYLARAGLRTLLLERRSLTGGACVTEELWSGFRISRAAYVVGLLRPALIEELALARRGLRLLRRDPSSFTPLPDGRGLLLGPDLQRSCDEIRHFSPLDAARYPDYDRLLDRTARALEPLLDRPPPDPDRPRVRDLWTLLGLARRLFAMRGSVGAAAGLLLGSARNTLESWFESEPLRATLARDALIGAWAGSSSPGTGYVLFHHVMGRTAGARGVWAYVEGGMGRLAAALEEAVREAGCQIWLDAPAASIRVERGRVRGVELADGRFVPAALVISNADPSRTLLDLVGAEQLPLDVVPELRRLDFRSPVVKINLALDGLPRFRARSSNGAGPEHIGTIHVGASTLDALDDSFHAANSHRLPERPMVELTLPSVLDRTLAPPGRHVASLFVQHVPPDWSAAEWNRQRDAFADRVFALVEEVAPGFASRVIHREVLAPPDLERIFALTGGHIFHGAMSLDRLFFLRPLPGWTGYRTPIEGLYLCGAGTHPGGGVMGACGRNAAREVLRDLKTRQGRALLRAGRAGAARRAV
jgi:phytoene dehydrogenase-like protein